MTDKLSKTLYDRETSALPLRTNSLRKLYSDRSLIDNLDIVNELDGHSGCVNALSWSKSGNLLASGSDDQHLNIHTYQPQDAERQFKLTTTVATGHTANIFSVKFMPHSDDRTVITCAGDSEVRIFDLEYAGQTREASEASERASDGRRSRRNNIYDGVRYLSDGDTDCRVYRSHGDRVKRIVTESSPHLFLTCSEDGEVRQWDLRQPSSAYPPPRVGRFSSASDNNLPPPLISYKRYQLDLNSISCSASQPHYIALGGAHLHAFLHDRRMTGRDQLTEAGKPLSNPSNRTPEEERLMGEATQCVRKFAPKGQRKMRRTDNGHITALKISDARPNEMIVSWSGDHIYSFDLAHSPDASENGNAKDSTLTNGPRKRKRASNASQTSLGVTAARPTSMARISEGSSLGEEAALRVRYQNGQSEDIPLSTPSFHSPVFLTTTQRNAQRIAKAITKVRSSLFGTEEEGQAVGAKYSSALGHAAAIFSDIDEEMRDWRYPLDPSPDMVTVQRTLRQNRESTRRFVQAAGTVARVLGGKLQTPSGNSPLLASFTNIEARSNDLQLSQREQFGYDFIKAILLWLESGVGRLTEGFTRPEDMDAGVKAAQRLVIPAEEASVEAIDEYLIPYLLRMAGDRPVTNLEANRFEVDQNTQLFPTEKAAVLAFSQAVKIPFEDLSSAVDIQEGAENIRAQDRQTATKYWAAKVARGVLLNAAEGVNFVFVDRAFGGLGRVLQGDEIPSANGNGDEMEGIESAELLDQNGNAVDGANTEDLAAAAKSANTTAEDEDNEDGDEDMDEDSDNEHNHDEDNDSSSDPDEEDGVPNTGMPRFMFASATSRRRLRDKVAAHVPCSPGFRSYRGHCNVKTVKDVNYFGLDDEYVVSGSDDGNFFIWDRKTSELVNLLEGDGEVVNVVQGHPYETMLAVSGIDHTVKIFSADRRAREAARLGRGITAHDSSQFSSLAWPSRVGRRRVSRRSESLTSEGATTTTTSEPAVPRPDPDDDDDETVVAEGGLASRRRMHEAYRIMNQNDVDRQGGNQDALLTRAMLAHLARRMQAHRAALAANAGVGGDGGGLGDDEEMEDVEEEHGRIVIGEDCQVQ